MFSKYFSNLETNNVGNIFRIFLLRIIFLHQRMFGKASELGCENIAHVSDILDIRIQFRCRSGSEQCGSGELCYLKSSHPSQAVLDKVYKQKPDVSSSHHRMTHLNRRHSGTARLYTP